jgi:hypothetical protein
MKQLTEKEMSEILQAEVGLRDAGLDVDHEYSPHNAKLIDDYFTNNPRVPVTVASVYAFIEANKTLFKWRTPAQREHDKISAENAAAAKQLSAWLATQGKPGQLVNTGDAAYENLTLLLTVLRGYEISPARIRDGEDRIAHRPGRKLHYVPQPRRTEPQSPAAKADDGTPFLGRNLNEPEWVRRSRERSERDAKEAANQPSSALARSRAAAEAREKAESLQGSTHAETDQLRKIFVTSGTEIDWQATLASRLQMQKQFNRHNEVRRFIR